ncbi:DUF6445 family protein [Colwellia sp. RE-S-Sl-9]
MIKLNHKMKISTKLIGHQKTEIVIIDDVLEDINPLINYALNTATFDDESKSFYPGRRANLPEFYLQLINQLIEQVQQKTSLLSNLNRHTIERSAYSILTRNEKELIPEQCIPHYDNLKPNYIAFTHYLNAGEFGGTAFYRNKLTNIERVSEENISEYINSMNDFINKNGLFEQKYFSHSSELFELIDIIPYRQNRLVIYPGTHFHSPFLDNLKTNIIDNIETGRLTANIFIQFE